MTVPYCFIKIFTTNYQILDSRPISECVDESDFLPSLRQGETHIECKCCFRKIEYDNAAIIGKNIYPSNPKVLKYNTL